MNALFFPCLSAEKEVVVPISGVLLRVLIAAALVCAAVALVIFTYKRLRDEIDRRVPRAAQDAPDADPAAETAGPSPDDPQQRRENEPESDIPLADDRRCPEASAGTEAADPAEDPAEDAADAPEPRRRRTPAAPAAPAETTAQPSDDAAFAPSAEETPEPPRRRMPTAPATPAETTAQPPDEAAPVPRTDETPEPPRRRGPATPVVTPAAPRNRRDAAQSAVFPAGRTFAGDGGAPVPTPAGTPPERRRGMPTGPSPVFPTGDGRENGSPTRPADPDELRVDQGNGTTPP